MNKNRAHIIGVSIIALSAELLATPYLHLQPAVWNLWWLFGSETNFVNTPHAFTLTHILLAAEATCIYGGSICVFSHRYQWMSSAFSDRLKYFFYKFIDLYQREWYPCHWHSIFSCRGTGLYSLHCLLGTLSWEHACPVWTSTSYIVLERASHVHCVNGRGAVLYCLFVISPFILIDSNIWNVQCRHIWKQLVPHCCHTWIGFAVIRSCRSVSRTEFNKLLGLCCHTVCSVW